LARAAVGPFSLQLKSRSRVSSNDQPGFTLFVRSAISRSPTNIQGVLMRYLTLVASAALITIAASAANAEDKTAPGGSGVVQSTEGKGATDKDTTNKMAPEGDKSGQSSGNAPGGSGVEESAEGKGATNKQGMDMAPMGEKSGASSGTAPGGTGVEDSSEGKGATNKN
jgi:hypothetical protein